jgi:ABC-type multidrug transport system permease subunit
MASEVTYQCLEAKASFQIIYVLSFESLLKYYWLSSANASVFKALLFLIGSSVAGFLISQRLSHFPPNFDATQTGSYM